MNVSRFRLAFGNMPVGALFVVLFAALAILCDADSSCGQPSPEIDQRNRSATTQRTEAESVKPPDMSADTAISPQLLILFQRLDRLRRDAIKDARFVELQFADAEHPNEKVWLVGESDESITVLKDDLLPWTYPRTGGTPAPATWEPTTMYLWSIEDANFENICRDLSKPREGAVVLLGHRGILDQPGPSYRLLIAHAAWLKGLSTYCEPIISFDAMYKEDFKQYEAMVFEDLAWLSFLRGVSLLMFADRSEVIPHVRLASELSPQSEIGIQSKDLIEDLEKLVAEEKKPQKAIDESKLTVEELARLWVSQIKDVRCRQFMQPGFVVPYSGVLVGKAEEKLPTVKLRELGMDAVPALIEGLQDDTPTRTVYHWRDFHRSRVVWRVSDFAWHILRDITKRDLGNRPVIGFTFSNMAPVQKRQIISDLQLWYSANHSLSDEERMFKLFSSNDSDDWITAARYFVQHKYSRAVSPLIEKIGRREAFVQGELCELVAHFGDPAAIDVIRQVFMTAKSDSDRLSAAIALWMLGDDSGIPLAINYVKAKDPPDCGRDLPVWFLMLTKSKESMDTFKSVVEESSPDRAGELVNCIMSSITGDLWSKRRQPAGNVEVCPTLIAAMNRPEYTGRAINDVKLRIKDTAANAFILLRDGISDDFPDRSMVDPNVFNVVEPDEARRDAQIEALIQWHDEHKDRLSWDETQNRLIVNN